MAAPEWLQAGPGELDLVRPFQAGQALGQQDAYRRDQIAQEAQRTATARMALGLESKRIDLADQAQQFQQAAWNSQADMRSNQLALGQQQLLMATRANTNQTDDQAKLLDVQDQVSKLAAAGDFQGISALTPTGFQTPQGVEQFHKIQGDGLATIGGQRFLAQQNQNTTTLLEANSLGLQPVRDPNGQPDYQATNAAILARKTELAKAAAEASPSVLAESTRAQSMEKIAGIRADTSAQNNVNTNAARILNDARNNIRAKVVSGQIKQEEGAALEARALQDYNAAVANGGNGTLSVGNVSIPITPQAKATNYINSLLAPTAPSQ